MRGDWRRTSADGVVTRRRHPEIVVAPLAGAYSPVVLDFRDWSCDIKLRVQLADAFEGLTGVDGTWKSAYTARGNFVRTKEFARWCGDNNVRGLGEVSPDRWNSYLLHLASSPAKNNSRRRDLGALRQVLGRYSHRLHPELPKHLNRRLPLREGDESQPLDKDVFNAIRDAAADAVMAEYRRIHPNVLLLKQPESRTPSPHKVTRAEALRELALEGAPQSDAARGALGISMCDRRSSGAAEARPMLFVSYEGAVAIAVLIACLEGVNFTQINERKVPSGAPGLGVAEPITTVEDEKRRRRGNSYDAHAIPKNARRAMARIVEITQPARDYLAAQNLPGADRLIVYWPGLGGRADSPQVGLRPTEIHKNYRLSWWPDESVPVSFNRIRKTVRVLIDRSPQGHSRATWSTLYVAASDIERERLMTEAVETGLWAVIMNAEAHLKMRFERIEVQADTDTTIGGCVDFEHHPLTGEPCGDDFLLCLQCTHAFATPRHLPRLIELRRQLESIASTDGPDWTDFRAMAYGCLVALLDDRSVITADEYQNAVSAITEADCTEVTLLLNGKYT